MSEAEELFPPPNEAEVARALSMFAAEIRKAYGLRLAGLYLFGSRARGDHEPYSDADVAVVLTDGDWRLVPEKRRLARLAVGTIVDTGVHVQGWPVSASDWSLPETAFNPALIANMKRDARPLRIAP